MSVGVGSRFFPLTHLILQYRKAHGTLNALIQCSLHTMQKLDVSELLYICEQTGYIREQTGFITGTEPFCARNSPSFYPHERTVTPRHLPLSISDSVTLHCITLILLGSTIKLQEPSHETRNWGLPARINPPLVRHTQTTDTTSNNYYKTYTISLVTTLIGDGSLHNVGIILTSVP